MIRIVSWNIRQGGGSRVLKIVSAIGEMNPHIIALSEYQNNDNGVRLRTELMRFGYIHQLVSAGAKSDNIAGIFSKIPFIGFQYQQIDPVYSNNIVSADFSAFHLFSVYLPHKKKHQLFDFLTEKLGTLSNSGIIVGDFNTGINYADQEGNSFWYEDELMQLPKIAYYDAFRHVHGDVKEYSWYSHQSNGYRYDHSYVHKDLLPVVNTCYYEHQYRENAISDHSPMILELS